jgi:hypothetical protein
MPDSGIISPELDAEVRDADASRVLDVIVELVDGQQKVSSIAAAKERFSVVAKPVAEAISDSGGEVIGDAWLNHTLLARVPAGAVPLIAQLDGVAQVDLPHYLQGH